MSVSGKGPYLIAIVGGSGSGKSWLAEKLRNAFAPHASRLSLDDFYQDRSHLSASRRAKLNFDHPRAIDWLSLENALKHLSAGRLARVPEYDFATHCRRARWQELHPKRLIIIDGLWLLRRASLRKLFALTIYLDCPTRLRLQRRLARDLCWRGRTGSSVREQFWRTVEPMHARHVAPQARWADIILHKSCTARDILVIEDRLRWLLANQEAR